MVGAPAHRRNCLRTSSTVLDAAVFTSSSRALAARTSPRRSRSTSPATAGSTTSGRWRRPGAAGWPPRLTAIHLHDARARGCRTASLQSTAMAERVYAAAGFRDLGRILEYVPRSAEPSAIRPRPVHSGSRSVDVPSQRASASAIFSRAAGSVTVPSRRPRPGSAGCACRPPRRCRRGRSRAPCAASRVRPLRRSARRVRMR